MLRSRHHGKAQSAHWPESREFYKDDSDLSRSRPLSRDDRQIARKADLACIRYVDRQVGKVLDALETNGLANNTIVIVWGDHGWHLGESAMWGKHSPFERANKSTLTIRAPGVSRPGTVCGALVETIDLYPTLVDLCEPHFTETHWALDGVSLRPLLEGTASEIKPVSLSYWRNVVSIRSRTHRLIVGRDRSGNTLAPELYDIRRTPDPVQNLAAENPEIVQELRQHLPP